VNFEDEPPHNYCNECDTHFEDSFELIDHVLEDDEEFDPYLILPNGIKLLLGSLLRYVFAHAEEPDKIKVITQSTYVTLFAAENGYNPLEELIEDMVIKLELQNFDENFKKFMEEEDTDGEGGA
jgi:uncharacterized membrane protein